MVCARNVSMFGSGMHRADPGPARRAERGVAGRAEAANGPSGCGIIGRMPVERWRCPLVPQVKSAVLAAAGAAVAAVFFPLWFAIPVMVVLGAWGLGMCIRRSEVVLDGGNGLLVVRLGPIARRVRVASITAVQVDRAKVSIARSDGGEISFYAWRKSRLDAWLRVPMVAGDIGHAISRAADAARDNESVARSRPQSRGMAAVPLLACAGLLEVVAALLVRVSWPSPVMTALGVILALALGLSGIFYVMFSLWLLVTGRRSGRSRHPEPGQVTRDLLLQ